MTEAQRVNRNFKKLIGAHKHLFPTAGYTESIGVPLAHGVYVIYDPRNTVLHVGRTTRGKNGLRQRLNNHLLGQSSFVGHYRYLHGKGRRLRKGYKFQYILIKPDRKRALLEALAIGKLCPKHLGLSSTLNPSQRRDKIR